MKLKIVQHSTLYVISWVKLGPSIKVAEASKVLIYIEHSCNDEILFDVVDMDARHVL